MGLGRFRFFPCGRWRFAAAWLVVVPLVSAKAMAQAADPCLPRTGQVIRIAAVSERGEMRLSDDRLARLPGIDLGVDTLPGPVWARHLAGLRSEIANMDFLVDAGQGLADRWGRIAVHARRGDGSESLHGRLVSSGLARVLPSDTNEACQRHLLALERVARREKQGIWREPALRVIPARETEAIRAQHGRYALVEGRVVSVNVRPQRTYINYGRFFTRDFSVTVARRQRIILEKAGISLSSLKDKVVRVRGIVGGRLAPQIDIVSPAQIEVVEE